MSGIFTTFNTAKRGMFAQQNLVNTTSHNVANANTDGFSRQRVQLVATPGFSMPGIGMIGTGVDISTITRIRDSYLDTQIRYETSITGQYKARQEVLEQVEMIFMEPSDAGLNTLLGRMWDSWQELSKTPENSNARTIVKDNALVFTDSLNHMYEQLETLKSDSINLAEKKTLDIHSLLDQIRSLNDQIYKVVIKGEKPNDLMDQRDLLLDKLSEIIHFKSTEDKYGRISIESGGRTLLNTLKGSEITQEISVVKKVDQDGSGNYFVTLVRGGDSINGITTILIPKDDYEAKYKEVLKEGSVVFNNGSWEGSDLQDSGLKAFQMTHGELKGYQSIIHEVGIHQSQLDNLANVLIAALNTVHQDGGGIEFFVGNGAADITVNQDIKDDVNSINAGKAQSGPEGDGERALAIAQLRNIRLNIDDIIKNIGEGNDPFSYDSTTMTIENMSGGTTFENYYKDIVARLGINAQQADRMVDNQEALTAQLIQRRDSISGVSMDEEIANLVQFQHAYQANSKVISTLTLMLDTLINGMGV